MRLRPLAALAALALLAPVHAAPAQSGRGDAALTARERAAVVDRVLATLTERYVFPKTAAAAVADVRRRARAGAYERIGSPRELADSLTRHLQATTKDLHLRVIARPAPPVDPLGTELPTDMAAEWRAMHWGVERVQVFPGNVGYLDLTVFPPLAYSRGAIAAAMDFLAETDALVIDLRRNMGGEPETVAHVVSYLLAEGDTTLINTIRWRDGDSTQQFRAERSLPGTRYGRARPVYVLTSGDTFSGGEELAYDLKVLGRATLVGETTRGGANPAPVFPLDGRFSMQVPVATAVNPVTRTNWEGRGVAPDVAAEAARAMRVAHEAALRALLERTTDPVRRGVVERAIETLPAM